MRTSALELILATDRVRRRAAAAGFALPVLLEYAEESSAAPFLSSNMRGTFLQTRRSSEGNVRFAPTECPPEQEGQFMGELFRVLDDVSFRNGWANRCKTLREAKATMTSLGEKPRAVVVPPSILEAACGRKVALTEAERLMMVQGYVTRLDGLLVLAADLPDNKLLLASDSVGVYVRSYDHVGIMIHKADRSLVVVNGLA